MNIFFGKLSGIFLETSFLTKFQILKQKIQRKKNLNNDERPNQIKLPVALKHSNMKSKQ
jgi:hypothetical protein